jgi:hypothetical protein
LKETLRTLVRLVRLEKGSCDTLCYPPATFGIQMTLKTRWRLQK